VPLYTVSCEDHPGHCCVVYCVIYNARVEHSRFRLGEGNAPPKIGVSTFMHQSLAPQSDRGQPLSTSNFSRTLFEDFDPFVVTPSATLKRPQVILH